jgi:RNA polymerase sigma-70 factor (ECF subfamily)
LDGKFFGAANFATTHWSVVLAAAGSETAGATDALEQLCRVYWYPLYAFIRRRGFDGESAADLTQSFFAHLLSRDFLRRACPDKGRFRSYLLGALKRFLADESDRLARDKRGGTREIISLDGLAADERYRLEPADSMDPEAFYLRQWALTVLETALHSLEAEMAAAGKEKVFQRLQDFLVGEKGGGNYALAGDELGLSEAAIKMTVSRMRKRCRELLRATIAQTVGAPEQVDDEYRSLISALRR